MTKEEILIDTNNEIPVVGATTAIDIDGLMRFSRFTFNSNAIDSNTLPYMGGKVTLSDLVVTPSVLPKV